jgi:hypothetical protein
VDYEEVLDRAPSDATGTCTWLIQYDGHADWASSQRDILWYTAYPGSENTVLCRFVVEEHRKSSHIASLYYFPDESIATTCTVKAILQALLCQICDYELATLKL